ncbi:hypothetical protein [Nocardia cyriacigeorgica]|uniref:hypothetical protein n=1 Tax=Nocardia cyriacigeorgica TaxID=135487 RepID=UPI0024580509|nr:hypothetical protein [Nocardia cyriacigeorgica]
MSRRTAACLPAWWWLAGYLTVFVMLAGLTVFLMAAGAAVLSAVWVPILLSSAAAAVVGRAWSTPGPGSAVARL